MNCLSEAPSSKGRTFFLNLINRFFTKTPNINQIGDSEANHHIIKSYILEVDDEPTKLSEDDLIVRSITFKEKRVSDILTPRTEVVAIDVNDSVDNICEVFIKEQYSRIPIYEQDIDHIIGIISEREFLIKLIQNQDVNLREIVREPIFVIESMKISAVLTILQKQNAHIAIVVDEFGGTSGIVTLEDILEELVGEIRDEFDDLENDYYQINDNEFHFQASIDLSSFFQNFKIKKPFSRYLTLGGWLFESFKHVPKKGESLQYKNLTFIINEVQNRRIQSVIVKINHKNLQSKVGS